MARNKVLFLAAAVLSLTLLLLQPVIVLAETNFESVPEIITENGENIKNNGKSVSAYFPLSLEFKEKISFRQTSRQGVKDSALGGSLSARLYGGLALGKSTLNLNFKVYTAIEEGGGYKASSNIHLLAQELYIDHSFSDQLKIAAGRINIRGGLASGFNPTDWFKKNSLAYADSFDAADRREDRLGIVVLQGHYLTDDGLWQFGYRPQIDSSDEYSWLNGADVIGLGLDRTNAAEALFLKYTPSKWDNLSVTPGLYYENDAYGATLEASIAVKDDLVIYGEWFGQKRNNLMDEALAKIRSGQKHTEQRFFNQLAIGANWSLPQWLVKNEDIAIVVEYHYNEAGLTRNGINNWQEMYENDVKAFRSIPALAGVNQEPLSGHQIFTKFTWNNIIKTSDLSLISSTSLQDGSGFTQATWKIPLTDITRLDVQAYQFWGNDKSIYGSSPADFGASLGLIHNF